ncbi:ABC transporter ATP-binding protein [bacterium]|nr:ABC transporter ATP-binding protein [bacterium]
MSKSLLFSRIHALCEALLDVSDGLQTGLTKEPNKTEISLWLRIITPYKRKYCATIGCGLFAVIPGMALLLLVTYAISQLQGNPRLLSWPELVGEHASRWIGPLVRGSPYEEGLSLEFQRWFIAPALLVVGLTANVLRGIQEYFLEDLGENITRDLRGELVSTYLNSNYQDSRRASAALLSNFFGEDIREIRQCFTRVCGSIPTEIFNSAIYLSLLALLDTQLFVLFFAIFVPAGIVVRTTGTYLRRLARTGVHVQTEMTQSFHEKIKGWQSIQSFDAQNLELTRFEEKNSTIFNIWRRSARAKSLSSPTVEWLGIAAGACVLILALRRVSDGALSSSILTAFLVTVGQLSNSLQTAVSQLNTTKKGYASLKRMLDFIDNHKTSLTYSMGEKINSFEKNKAQIIAENIGIRANKESKLLVNNLCFSISSGENLAIVGASGSGKSTLLECISGLRPTEHGKIRCVSTNGESIIENEVLSKYFRVAYLTQDPFVFAGSVGDNVMYPEIFQPNNPVHQERVETSLQNACLNAKKASDDALSLSGGERQRLAFARAFCAMPHIWLIDEGTSALDTTTEKELLKNLEKNSTEAIKIFVAHRPIMKSIAHQIIEIGKDQI